MRTVEEINNELRKICDLEGSLSNDTLEIYDVAAFTAQALAWVLGEEISASEMFNDLMERKKDE